MIQAIPSEGASQQQQRVLVALRTVTLFLAVTLFGAIILAPVKHGREEYEVFIGFWALMALPLGVETAWGGLRWRRAQQMLGVGLTVMAIASLIAVIGWLVGNGPTAVGVLTLGPALVALGLACQALHALDTNATTRRR